MYSVFGFAFLYSACVVVYGVPDRASHAPSVHIVVLLARLLASRACASASRRGKLGVNGVKLAELLSWMEYGGLVVGMTVRRSPVWRMEYGVRSTRWQVSPYRGYAYSVQSPESECLNCFNGAFWRLPTLELRGVESRDMLMGIWSLDAYRAYPLNSNLAGLAD